MPNENLSFNAMKIKSVSVINLFGIFNHIIPLNLEEHITIIHGPNGYGKTILLKIIQAIFNSNYSFLREIPFSEVLIEFENNRGLRLRKNKQATLKDLSNKDISENENFNYILLFDLMDHNVRMMSHKVEPMVLEPGQYFLPLSRIEREIPNLARIGQETWLLKETGETLSFEAVLYRYKDRLSFLDKSPFGPLQLSDEPEWFQEIKKAIKIYFIETNRLYSYSKGKYEDTSTRILSVINYSEDLASMIKENWAKYGEISQSLDRAFPLRLVKTSDELILQPENLKNKLDELEKRRSQLVTTGLLDKDEDLDLRELFGKIDESNKKVLSIYITDVEEKLKVFDELCMKINIFKNIINNRFLYKKMIISKKDGYIFKTSAGDTIAPSALSSGEQHELVMFFELLFKIEPNSLILIDEPEISLHIIWQQQFIKDLQEIASLGKFDVLIATHSPQIVYDRSDLTVALEGPSDV